MTEHDLVLVTAATGKTGMPVVAALRERGLPVRALVHRLDERADRLTALGVDVVEGDLLDADAVSRATEGVGTAYFCYPITPGLLDATGLFAQAASEAGVRAVVNMSQISARRQAKSHAAFQHWLSERLFDSTTMMTTHLRPTFFGAWLTMKWVPGVVGWSVEDGTGVLRLPFGAGRHGPIAETDQGRFIAAVLANPVPHDRQTYALTGPVDLDHHQIADELAGALGIPVRYESIEIPVFSEALLQAGYPPFLVQHLASVAQNYREGVFAGANDLVEVVTGTAAQTVRQFAAANRSAFLEDGLVQTR
ncbi:nucleotide-diphosphate-sugar epimerase [Mycolicibacterium madagascariense]|uniref:Nucleotide-diphosphate-sugar epimerase n=1 Tax=Mycolicibacterium madagascariense TaxID=212765 RepID=A0A7I7XCJ5_9MYCO|nr:NmrA family NAD(P)-binding protein [Mycolicibacterium madagascariense]MCV7013544.1 NmrA family NAD(P)-binding protein [Mycolicibacterium madagascariense]BBZ26990.1 nucleotide-diphosphate-sugar epimerase [Mycolicibacterium madagascariense]